MISLDPIECFEYPIVLALPDLTTKVNSFDDLNKNTHLLIKPRISVELFTHYIFGYQRTGLAIG